MAKLPMKKITLLAHKKERKAIMELLQRRGVVHIEDIKEEGLQKLDTSQSRESFEKSRRTAEKALEILAFYAPRKKKGLLGMFREKKGISLQRYGELAAASKRILADCYDIIECDKSIAQSKAEIARLEAETDMLSPWLGLDVLPSRAGLSKAKVLVGTLPQKLGYDELVLKLDALLAGESGEQPAAEYEIISDEGTMTRLLALCHVSDAARVEGALRSLGFSHAFDRADVTPKAKLEELKKLKFWHEENIQKQKKAIAEYESKRDEIEFVIDYLTMREDKYRALEGLGLTSATFVLTGYIPETQLGVLKELEKFDAAVEVSDPEPAEEVPVLLHNNAFVEGVEPITEMFSIPSKEDLDPNPVLSIFYYVLFGIMLSDAAYGVIMVIVSAYALKKLPLKRNMYKTMKLFLFCGISTVFWGALFGSWFGDAAAVIAKTFFNSNFSLGPLWFEPMKDPMQMLAFSCALGVVHILAGICLKFATLWKLGQKWDAVFDAGLWIVLIIGLCGIFVGSSAAPWVGAAGQYMAIAGAIGIVLTGGRHGRNVFSKLGLGLYSLYGVSGYLSDVLSYSRLLALGLATGVVAMVFNSIAAMGGGGVFGAIVFIIVFVIGHTVNIAINLLGAYVHTNRLQFVEFFSKFYNGGGIQFRPLSANTKYYDIKEDY